MVKKIRFGIIGCSRIARRSTIPAIINSKFSELTMIGSRNLAKAENFAKKFGCEKYGSYEEVLSSEIIDSVYISVPIGLHEKWVLKAAKAGKHIICEKSSTTSYRSAKKMVEVCKKNQVRLMEGFMFRFHPQHAKVKELIQKGMLGELFTFSGYYGFPPVSKDDIRYNVKLGAGVLNETGCYPICTSRTIFNENPIGIICNLFVDSEGIDQKGHCYILYGNNKTALIAFSFLSSYQANYKIWGKKGIIELDRAYSVPPNLETSIKLKIQDKNFRHIKIKPVDHFIKMIDTFSNEVNMTDSSSFNFEDDLLIQSSLMEAARKSNKNKKFIYLNEISGR